MPVQGLHPRLRSFSGDSYEALRGTVGDGKSPSHRSPTRSQRSLSLGVMPDADGHLVPDENGLIDTTGLSGGAPGGAREATVLPESGADTELLLPEVLNFNSSIYDLTIQYSCNVAYRHGDYAGILNLVMVLVLQILNVYLQMIVLIEVDRLIARPAMAHAQYLYQLFTDRCYDQGNLVYSDEVERSFVEWRDQEKSELCAFPLASPQFFTAILLIWTFFLMCEIKQTVYLSWHLLKLSRPVKGQVFLSEVGEYFIISEAGVALKLWVVLTVLLPKFAIAVILWYIGARWLTATTGIDNLVLNALALTFICELDELIFQTCVPEVTKSCLDKVKLPLPPIEYSPTLWGPLEMIGTLAMCGCLTMLYIYQLQDVMPNYRFDLEKVCGDVKVAALGRHLDE